MTRALALLLFCACSSRPEPVLSERPLAPLRVGWTVVEEGPAHVRLVARVEWLPGLGLPVDVSVSVPPGAQRVEGPPGFVVAVPTGARVEEVAYTLAFESPPPEDLVLVAQVRGQSFGAHAEARYRFGRPPEEGPRPRPTGPELPPEVLHGSR